jgi:hypothetical protein
MYNTCTPTSKVKVTLRGPRLTEFVIWYILCPEYNFFKDQGILNILGTNGHNDKIISQHLCPYLQCQGHI